MSSSPASEVPRVALLSCPLEAMHKDLWSLARNEPSLENALKSEGFTTEWLEWGDSEDQMQLAQSCDVVIIRSTWDYSDSCETKDKFLAWLRRLTRANTTLLFNTLEIIEWNSDKRYMLDLQSRGVPIVPTEIVEKGASIPDVLALANTWNTDCIIVKPVVGASARGLSKHTFVDGNVTATEEVVAAATKSIICVSNDDGGALLQPFLPAIHQGETSVICIDGTPLVAVLKTPADGDFRVQEEHGGKNTVITLTPAMIAASCVVLENFPLKGTEQYAPLYARLDFVAVSTGTGNELNYLLMEAECIEPEIFVNICPEVSAALAKSVAAAYRDSRGRDKTKTMT